MLGSHNKRTHKQAKKKKNGSSWVEATYELPFAKVYRWLNALPRIVGGVPRWESFRAAFRVRWWQVLFVYVLRMPFVYLRFPHPFVKRKATRNHHIENPVGLSLNAGERERERESNYSLSSSQATQCTGASKAPLLSIYPCNNPYTVHNPKTWSLECTEDRALGFECSSAVLREVGKVCLSSSAMGHP